MTANKNNDNTPSTENNTSPSKTIEVSPLLSDEQSLMGEQFRKLRTVLKVHHLGNNLKSILITGLAPNEGKTTVALNLAASLARGLDVRIILIDADLRKRSLTSLLGLQKTSGLSELIAGKAKLTEILVQTEISGLRIIPAGFGSSNPAELLESERMKELLRVLAATGKTSYIVLDSPPFIAASEAFILSHLVDGVILVVMAEKTRRDIVKRELASIGQTKILGVVLNRAKFETSHYYQKYYRSYYGKKD
jgi:capsular exopolysaccharide synthesis family protein